MNFEMAHLHVKHIHIEGMVNALGLTMLGNGNLELLTRVIEGEARHLAISLHYTLLRGESEWTEDATYYEHPDGWWQAFRQRWFPGWWLKRYPVKNCQVLCQKNVRVNVCPHLPHDPRERHIKFLVATPEQIESDLFKSHPTNESDPHGNP